MRGSQAHAQVHLNIGVTAHRDLVDAEIPRLRAEVRAFLAGLGDAYPDLPLRVISALATGGDQLVADEALALGIELVVPLPLPLAAYEHDFEDPESLARFRTLLAQARVRTLPLAPRIDVDDVQARGSARNRQYAQLGMFVSSHCQLLLALWDGRPSDATGGTAQVVDYHLRNTMPGFRTEDIAPNLLADDESDLVYHVHCPRRMPHPGPGPGTMAVPPPRWVTLDGESPGGAPPPAQYRHVFAQLQAFNRDAARHREAIAGGRASLLGRDMPAPPPAFVRETDALFGTADWLAAHFRGRMRGGMLATHALAAAMGLAFILYSDLAAHRGYVALFLLLFAAGALVRWIAARREWHRKFLDYRGLAEGLRVQVYWRLAGVETPPNSSLGYDSFLQKQDVDLSWIRHAMRGSNLLRDDGFASDTGWLHWVIAHWVGTGSDPPGDTGGQLRYFRAGVARREAAYRTTTRLGELALAGGLLGALALLVLAPVLDDHWRTGLLVAMGLLPLVAGIREALAYKNADKELIKQFRFMRRLFESCRWRLDLAADDDEARHLLRALGCACLEEHAEWILLHRERPLEGGSPSA